jgi:hypothetical protein
MNTKRVVITRSSLTGRPIVRLRVGRFDVAVAVPWLGRATTRHGTGLVLYPLPELSVGLYQGRRR